jgi:hypothetical protein
MMTVDRAILIVLVIAGGICISWSLAAAGEPQSVWLWRDVLQVMP